MPKTARNAAKIFNFMKADGRKVNARFENTKMLDFIKSLRQEDLDDSFNPYRLRDRWLRFFRSGL